MKNQNTRPGPPGTEHSSHIARLLRTWFELTTDEQKAVAAVLSLFLLGLAARAWHLLSPC